MNVLMVGDIVGAAGRAAFRQVVARLRSRGLADFVIANAENAAGGKGLTLALAEELRAAGADVLTLGDHTWDQKDVALCLNERHRVIRPANFAPGCPGEGLITVQTACGPLSVINLVGRVFMAAYDCPFRAVDALLSRGPAPGRMVFVDFHAEATSEKMAMGWYLDGRVTCVAGTHTHVQTSDAGLLPGGTAYITDLGMTGAKESVIGLDIAAATARFLTGMPMKFKVAERASALEGVIVRVNSATARADGIEPIREPVSVPEAES